MFSLKFVFLNAMCGNRTRISILIIGIKNMLKFYYVSIAYYILSADIYKCIVFFRHEKIERFIYHVVQIYRLHENISCILFKYGDGWCEERTGRLLLVCFYIFLLFSHFKYTGIFKDYKSGIF